MKYANYDETNGKLSGWYDSEIHETIPTPNIEVSDEDWQVAIDNNYNFVDVTTNTLSFKDFRTFTDLQKAKVSEIKQAFTTATKAGFTCSNNITMDADLQDIIALKAGYDLEVSFSSTTIDITDYSNKDHLGVAIDDVFTMIQELGANYKTLRAKKNTLRELVNTATTQSDLDAISW